MLTDKEIIEGFPKGEKEAYRTVTGWIEEIVRIRLWENSISPEDIISDASYKLLKNFSMNRFKYESSLKSYVQQVTRFTIIDAVRRRRLEMKVFKSVSQAIPDPPMQEKYLHNDETDRTFQRILSLIDPRCLELWTLIFCKRMKYKIIASKLRVSEGTIKTRVFRCKEEAIAIRKSIE